MIEKARVPGYNQNIDCFPAYSSREIAHIILADCAIWSDSTLVIYKRVVQKVLCTSVIITSLMTEFVNNLECVRLHWKDLFRRKMKQW